MTNNKKQDITKSKITFRMRPDTYYIWCGGSCNYSSKRRESGGAYIMEKEGMPSETYVISDIETTEFRMILRVMIHAMEVIPENAEIVFLTNVAYIQNFDAPPTDKSANADFIQQCINLKEKHRQVSVKIVSYHKYPQLPRTHELAHEAMKKIMEKGKS